MQLPRWDVVLVTTGACVGPESAEIRRDFTCAVLDKAVGMPLVCRNCGGSAVTVHRQVWFTCLLLYSDWCRWSRQCSLVLRRGQLIFSMMSSGYFFKGPAHRCRAGGRVHRDTAPIIRCIYWRVSTKTCVKSSVRTTTTTTRSSSSCVAFASHWNSSGRHHGSC